MIKEKKELNDNNFKNYEIYVNSYSSKDIKKLPKVFNRIYNDYFMPNRYKEYAELIKMFQENNYQFIRVKDYKKLLEIDTQKYIILRHDIDSDIHIARKLFEIEKSMNIKATYYFRLSTIDKKLMQEIIEYGSEVGYHYEELAQYCKDHKIIAKDFAREHIADMQSEMIKNIKKMEKDNNLKIESIASHGDFVNRKINILNKEVYDEKLKEKLKLIEAYDIEKYIDFRTADRMYPIYWKENPRVAIQQNKKRVLILTHPRWWNSAPLSRLKLDLQRIIEKFKYK